MPFMVMLALKILIELSNKATHNAAQRLGQAIGEHKAAEQKLLILQQHYHHYIASFQQSLVLGLAASHYQNFQTFMSKLEAAMTLQQNTIQAAQQHVATAQRIWQACESKRLSYSVLVKRAKQSAQLHANRYEQKLTDEHAGRKAFYKR